MIVSNESSNYSMSDYYSVLKWMPRSEVDRQEPVIVLDELVEGESIVLPTIYEEFNGIDDVHVFLNFNGVHVNASDIILSFSPLVEGNLSLLSVNCSDDELDYDNDTMISFKLDDNLTFTDPTRCITGAKSIKISFNTDATGVILQKIIMRSQNYTYTLSDIEHFLITGENHIITKLKQYSPRQEIPPELQQHTYMAAGAYAWLSRWEYEAKPMKESKAESDNYATRLLNQVDDAIAEYISNIESRLNQHDTFHATATHIDWGN